MESAERKRKTLINIKADQKFIDRLDVFWREAGYSTRTDFILDTLEKRMFAKEIKDMMHDQHKCIYIGKEETIQHGRE